MSAHDRAGPTLTAAIVALARAVAGADGGLLDHTLDAVAPNLLPFWQKRQYHRLCQHPKLLRFMRKVSAGVLDHVPLRTLAIDERVEHSDAPQVLILGAGLDARAMRLARARDKRVFEVDRKGVLDYKRQRLGKAWPSVAVAVDFEHDDLRARIIESGFRHDLPTCVILEGVTPYLPESVQRGLFATLARLCAKDSELLVTYVLPSLARMPERVRPFIERSFQMFGEPLRGATDTPRFHERLESAGFTVVSDTGSRDWAKLRGVRRLGQIDERLVVATFALTSMDA
jgi:methyltransferase (TIGR00027 family)